MPRRAPTALARLVLGGAARAGAPPKVTSWRDPEVLKAALAEACDAVEEVCGAKFEPRPETKLSTAEEMAVLLEEEIRSLAPRIGLKMDEAKTARLASLAILAKVDRTRRVHLIPEVIDEAGETFGRDELRVLLAHECTHVLDAQRFGIEEREDAVQTGDANKALQAIVEGHAQWVAQKAAARWKTPEAFVRLTDRILGKPALPLGTSPDMRSTLEAVHVETTFAYAQGLSFFLAIDAVGGRDAIERAMRDPPATTRAIERPEEWLRGGPAPGEPDLEALVETARPWVADPAWNVATMRISEALLRSQAAQVPEAERTTYLEGYVDGRALRASVPGDPVQVLLLVVSFRTPEDAQRYVRQATAGRPAQPGATSGSGAGPGGRFPGTWSHLERDAEDGKVVLDVAIAAVGPVAVSVVVAGDGSIDRAAIDELLVRVEARLADPKAAPPPSAARPYVYVRKTRMVRVFVSNAHGAPIPRARVHVFLEDRRHLEGRVSQGLAEIAVPRRAATVAVWGAAAADGTPLDVAPQWGIALAPDALDVSVRLVAPGSSIGGKVVDEHGVPVAGAVVTAQGTSVEVFGLAAGSDQASAKTGLDGVFEIVGLAPQPYALRVGRGERRLLHDDVEARGGDREVLVRLRATTGARLRVLDAEGKGLRGALVSVDGSHGSGGRFFGVVRAEDGSIDVDGLDASAELWLSVTPPETREDVGRLERAWTLGETEVRLPRGWVLRGTVLDDAGKPTAAVVWWRTGRGRSSVRSGPDGRFVIRGVPGGPAEIAAAQSEELSVFGFADVGEWTEVAQGAEAALRVRRPEAPRTVTVRVRAPDGAVVPSARLWIETHEGSSSRATTESTPTFTPPSKPYDLEVYAARDAEGRPLDLGPARRVGLDPSLREIEVTLPPGRRIAGRVRTNAGDGKGVPRVRIDASSSPGAGRMAVPHAQAESDADGSFVLHGLGEGTYTLAVDPPRPFARPDDVEAESGADDLAIWVSPAERRTVTVVDWEGKPVPFVVLGLEVITRHGAGSWSTRSGGTATTDAEGKAAFEELAPGAELHLEVSLPRGREDLRTPAKRRWKPPEEDRIVLERGFAARGRVAGEGVRAGVYVVAWWDGRRHEVARTEADGGFLARGLPYHDVTLAAALPLERGASDEEGPGVRVTPDAPTATLELPRKPVPARIRVAGYGDGRQGFVASEDGPAPHGVRTIRFGAEGAADIPKLPPGSYSVWIPPVPGDATCVWKKDVRLGEGDVTLEPGPCAVLRFRLKMPADSVVHQTDVFGPLEIPIPAKPGAGGAYEVRVPAGTWKVKAKVRAPSDWLYATVEVSTDVDVEAEVELKPYGAK